MRKVASLVTVAVLPLVHQESAWGCGATPDVVDQFLPALGAVEVPTDTALFVATNLSVPTAIALHRVDASPEVDDALPGERFVDAGEGVVGARDAGAPSDVEVTLTCYDTGVEHLCVAKPTHALDANTTYQWSVATEATDSTRELRTTTPQRFTTGTGPARATNHELRATVVSHQYELVLEPCGGTLSTVRRVVVEVTATGLDEPLLVKAPPRARNGWGAVLLPDSAMTQLTLDDPPECLTLEAISATGELSTIDQICPEELQPLVGAPPASTEVANSASPPAATETQDTTLDVNSRGESPASSEGAEPSGDASAGDGPSAGLRHNATDETNDSGACAMSPRRHDAFPSFGILVLVALGAVTTWRRHANDRAHD